MCGHPYHRVKHTLGGSLTPIPSDVGILFLIVSLGPCAESVDHRVAVGCVRKETKFIVFGKSWFEIRGFLRPCEIVLIRGIVFSVPCPRMWGAQSRDDEVMRGEEGVDA